MLRPELFNKGASGPGYLSGVMVLACLALCWSKPAFSAEPTAEPTVAPDESSHMQLAPISVARYLSGNIGYEFQRASSGPIKSVQQGFGVGVSPGIQVSSFFWQPWLAQVSSQLVANINCTSTNSNTTPTYTTLNTYINGEAALNLVKLSRFPFEARIFRNDGRYEAFYSGTNFASQHTGYKLSQSYTTRNRRLAVNASYSNETYSNASASTNIDGFNFNSTLMLSRTQSISLAGSTRTSNTPTTGLSNSYDTLLLNHGYAASTIFQVSSMASMYKMNYDLTQANSAAQQYDSSARQFTSYASLRPEKTPLTVTSTVRFIQSDSSSNGTPVPTLTASYFNLGANYLFSRMIRMYGSVAVEDSLGTQTVRTNAALAGARPFATTTVTSIGGFRYTGSVGGSLATNNRTTINSAGQTTATNALNAGLYLSHALDKSSEFGAGNLSENLHQTISGGASDSGGTTISNLNTGGSLSWRQSEGKANKLLRLSAADSRSLRGTPSAFQMINMQVSRNEAINRNETLSGGLTIQATQSQYAGQQSPRTLTPSAVLSYFNQRAFKVLHLNFESWLRISDANILQQYQQNPLAQDQATRSWDNNFSYYIGRLKLRLNTRVAINNNVTSSFINFSLNRPF